IETALGYEAPGTGLGRGSPKQVRQARVAGASTEPFRILLLGGHPLVSDAIGGREVPYQSEADFRGAICAYLRKYWDWKIPGVAEPWLLREIGMDPVVFTFEQRINYHGALAVLQDDGVIAVRQCRT